MPLFSLRRMVVAGQSGVQRRVVFLSAVLSALLILATTFVLVAVVWQGASSFLDTLLSQRLDGGEQSFAYFVRQRNQDLDTLVHWAAADSAVLDYGAGRGTAPPSSLNGLLGLGSADFIAVRSVNGGVASAPAGLAPLVDDTSTLQWRTVMPLPAGGEVIAGYLLGPGFADRFKAWTGLDIALYTQTGSLSGTSLHDTSGSPLIASRPPAGGQLSAGGVLYQVRSFTLYDSAQRPIGSYLVGLPASMEASGRSKVLQDFLPYLSALLIIAVLSTLLLARQVTAPLRNLRRALSRIGQGDLDTPIRGGPDSDPLPLAEDLEELRQRLHAALNQLAIEKSMYQGIFRSMGNAVFTTDAQGGVTSFNPAASALLGSPLPLGEGQGEGPLTLGGSCSGRTALAGSEDNALCERACVWLWMTGDSEPTVVRSRLRPDEPDPRDLEVTVTPIKDEESRTVGLVHVVRDITLEQELERLKERFLMSVAHELRTPLSSLSASVELLQDDFDALSVDSRTRMLGTVRRGAQRLGHLVTDLLDLGSIQAGRFTVKLDPVPLLGPVQEAVALTETLLQVREQTVEVALADPGLMVLADPARLCQVLVNLIANAGKYGVEGDGIRLAAIVDGRAVRVSVSDHGPGISAEERQRVFDLYFRGSGAARAAEGFGLGLAIIKGIVDAHGGDLGVDSEPGQGTTFWFTIPLVGEPVPA